MTKREQIAVIAGEHGWRETSYSSERVLQIDRGTEIMTIGLLPNDGGLGTINYCPMIGVTQPVKSGLPGLLAIVRKRPE